MENADYPGESSKRKRKLTSAGKSVTTLFHWVHYVNLSLPFQYFLLPKSMGVAKIRQDLNLFLLLQSKRKLVHNVCHFLTPLLSLLQNLATCHEILSVLRLLFLDVIQNQHMSSTFAVCFALGSFPPHSAPRERHRWNFKGRTRSLAASLWLFSCWLYWQRINSDS